MVALSSQSLRISRISQSGGITPAQKKFNTLVSRIERQRQRLKEWQDLMPIYQEEVLNRFGPLRERYADFQAMLVVLLDAHCLKNRLTRAQMATVSHIIVNICEELILDHGRDDLKSIANRHGGMDFDDQQELKKTMGEDMLRAMLESEFELDLDGVELDTDDPHGTAERLGIILDEQRCDAEARRPRRKKTARQLAREQQEKEEEARISRSIQTVYRQLVAALHPDREKDPEEHRRKTDLMQEVTVAYKNRDLLQLLELQLRVEQIDRDEINRISEERLKHFNKILQRQSQELKQEIEEIELNLKAAAGFAPLDSLTPRKFMSALRNDTRELEFEIVRIQKDLVRFKDVRNVKSWIKSYRLSADPLDDLMFDVFR